MTNDAFNSVLVPILRDLRDYLGDLVVIGGWVPELHRRFGGRLVVNEKATAALRQRLGQSLSVRHRITQEGGDARARGFLADFLGLIPA